MPISESTDESVWKFSNTQNKTQTIKVMGLRSARAFVTVIKTEDLVYWTVQQGTGREIFVNKCEALFNKAVTAAPIQSISVVREVEKKTSGGGRERRKHKRITVRLNVLVIKDKEVFKVCSKDISTGGLMLENPVPKEFMDSTVRIIVTSSDLSLNVQFEGIILEASARGSRIMFEGMKDTEQLKLKRWIEVNDPDTKKFNPLTPHPIFKLK
jgi:hypothetical protein